ncbi:restriction endonuclease subunit S [Bifidobacterium pseudolongum]|uniref:restriction endonuclease subunit S n=1 Tax=Bifidobacterium pseudolongum TaxID=1694 RepID=UPI0013EB84F9|nr:restriction endonuclease subunit S [Bifidobacterium pseudolongum]
MKLGDIAFEGNRNKRFPFGRFVENMIGEGIVSHVFSVYRPIVKQSSLLFLKYYVNNDYVIRNMLRKSTIAATMMRTLVDADLMRQTLTLPSGREQEKIGKLFVDIDNLIDAEKRKLELLEKKREELLQCVFSQRLRLNGCTEDCPQYSLAELEMNGDIHMGRGKVISAIQMKKNPGIYPVYSSSSKNNGEMGRYGEYMFDHELVTWSIDGGGHVFYRAKHRFSITNVCGYIQVRNNIDCSFLAYQMMFKHSKLHFDYTSKALPSLIKNMYDLSMPSLYEQERIGRLFKVFDSLIEFISHKIELTEQKKKALLQTMFL